MANKYIRHGATYNGDGTSSALATVDGGVGAWNNINILTGTAPAYGSLAAGDTVYIRSKDASDTNITVTFNAASIFLGSSSASVSSWITWIIDGGTIWSGVNGVVTYSTNGAYSVTPRNYNRFICESQDSLVIKTTETNAGSSVLVVTSTGIYCEKVFFDCSTPTTGFGRAVQLGSGTYNKCHFKVSVRYVSFLQPTNYVRTTLIDPDIELTTNSETDPVIGSGGYMSTLEIFGGYIHGAGTLGGQAVCTLSTNNSSFRAVGLYYPTTMILSNPADSTTPASPSESSALAVDGGIGAVYVRRNGVLNSRSDGYYPTLNAYLPNSTNTPWSWYVYPYAAAIHDSLVLNCNKVFTDTAATKTITLEFLVSTAFTGLDKSNCKLQVTYIDNTTGLPTSVLTSAMASGALDSSTASWSATTYGAINFNKRKLSLTTPTSIKKDTLVTVTLFITKASASTNDVLFVDPDPSIS